MVPLAGHFGRKQKDTEARPELMCVARKAQETHKTPRTHLTQPTRPGSRTRPASCPSTLATSFEVTATYPGTA